MTCASVSAAGHSGLAQPGALGAGASKAQHAEWPGSHSSGTAEDSSLLDPLLSGPPGLVS